MPTMNIFYLGNFDFESSQGIQKAQSHSRFYHFFHFCPDLFYNYQIHFLKRSHCIYNFRSLVVVEVHESYKHPMSIVFLLSYFPLDPNMMKARSRNKLVFLWNLSHSFQNQWSRQHKYCKNNLLKVVVVEEEAVFLKNFYWEMFLYYFVLIDLLIIWVDENI